jgi:triosephosphate isomerase
MARKDLIAGNWKMNATHLEGIQMVQKLGYRLDPGDYERVDVVVCPPFTALRSAQNVYWETQGAFTGEISPPMLARLGVKWVVVGHSERRHLFGEDDATVAKKARAVLAAGMVPIVAVGETLEQREGGVTELVIGTQLRAALEGLDAGTVASLVVAYEPVWAIGTGRTASDEQAAEAIGYLRGLVGEGWGPDAADRVRILYGGSVTPGNIAGLMAKRDIDGALVGGASLDPDKFASIVRYWV